MKIGYDAKRLFCNYRGLGNYSRDLVRILSSHYPENNYHLYTPEIKINVPVNKQNTGIFLPKGLYSVLPHSLWRSYGMTNQILKNGDQIFHGLNQELPLGLENSKLKKIITFHDAIFIRYPELYDATYRKIFTIKNKKACAIADKIVAISEQSKRDVIEFFCADEKKVDVIYQGCSNIFREKYSSDFLISTCEKYALPKDFMLFVGAIEPRKNLLNLLHAVFLKKIDFPLVIVGRETEYSKTLQKYCNDVHIQNKVFFLTNVPTADLPALYQSAKLFIYTSVFEGFGIPVLEALLSNTPVITSHGSCLEESGGKFSKYVHSDNVEEMGAAILQVLNDSDLQQFMKREGLKHAAKFTDEKIATKMITLYKNLL